MVAVPAAARGQLPAAAMPGAGAGVELPPHGEHLALQARSAQHPITNIVCEAPARAVQCSAAQSDTLVTGAALHHVIFHRHLLLFSL